MHPDITRAVVAQRIADWVAAADADRIVRQARHSNRGNRVLRHGRRFGRSVATGRQAARSA